MDKAKCLELFNMKLKEFVNDLIVVFPQDSDLYSFKTSLNVIGLVNDKQMIELFIQFVHNVYRSRIMNRDESFFLTHTYTEEVTHMADQNVTQQLIDKIKSYWSEMSEQNKNTVWQYFEVLIKLTDRYILECNKIK